MRILSRIKQPIFYAKYIGKEEITETYGGETIRTGDFQLLYTPVENADVYFSTPKRGEAYVDGDGTNVHYVRTIVSEKDLGLVEEDIIWVGIPEVDAGEMWEGGLTLDGGTMSPWSVEENTNGGLQWTTGTEVIYRILSIKKSFHHTTYEVEQL